MDKELLEKYPIFNKAQEITHLNKNLIRVEFEDNILYYDINKDIFLNFDYFVAGFTKDGVARTVKYDKNQKIKLYGYINDKYEILIPPICEMGTVFENGYASIKVREKDNKLHYYIIDTKGNKVLNVDKYKYVGEMHNGLIRVSSEEIDDYDCVAEDQLRGCFGFIDITGKEIIKPQFFETSDFETDYIAAHKLDDWGWGVLNKKGEVVIPFEYINMFNPFCVKDFNDNNKYFVEVFIPDDKTIPPEDFVDQEGKWDILDILNNKLLGIYHDDYISYTETYGYIRSTLNGKHFIYDLLTNKFLDKKLSEYFPQKRNKFYKDGKEIITDNDGNIINKPKR